MENQGDTALALRARGLTKTYGSGGATVRAVDHVDLDIPEGVLTAVMGPSGSGKTTLVHLLAGLDRPDGGQVWVGDDEITAMKDKQLAKVRGRIIGFVFQGFNLLQTMTARENIVLPLRLNALPADDAWLDSLVEMLGIGRELERRPYEMSGGQQQRVAIARALITKPRIVLADEPTGNLDTHASAEILAHLRQSCRELGQSVVMVTHDPAAASYAGRVLLFADGKVAGHVTDPTPDAVLAGLDALAGVER
ncbi:ABC transporter ATP-binding protein [Demequina mangrovi]|uniref:Putative ABC transport system ATP-binding protein n=1 Tax=Demequina mangrovi TaxID=1043493 RepID=A0A1H7AK04_9MICO|nr:ABC transporter ATP-binding protein [Demequina mangrovi]SEJ62230.1 putative ABC transport system ATP-binding protein [Demequina mangrovi]